MLQHSLLKQLVMIRIIFFCLILTGGPILLNAQHSATTIATIGAVIISPVGTASEERGDRSVFHIFNNENAFDLTINFEEMIPLKDQRFIVDLISATKLEKNEFSLPHVLKLGPGNKVSPPGPIIPCRVTIHFN